MNAVRALTEGVTQDIFAYMVDNNKGIVAR